ncbi:MAG: hypothetical protein ACOX52_17380 [Verrucomicrobiota bacterium]
MPQSHKTEAGWLGPESYTYTAKRYTYTYTMTRRVRVRVRVGESRGPVVVRRPIYRPVGVGAIPKLWRF